MTPRQPYNITSKEFLTKAYRYLDQGDLLQASEKGWGAAAQIVKAISERRGWQHNGHFHLFRAVRNLAEETGDGEITALFHIANSLHSNFYENWLPLEEVTSGLEGVAQFVEKVERLLVLGGDAEVETEGN